MNLYEIRFPGHLLGGVAIVAAPNEARALHIMKLELPKHRLFSDEPYVVRQLNAEGIVYMDSGDY